MDEYIKIAYIDKESVSDGNGVRYVIFFQGCKHNCFNCHNPQTHDFNNGFRVNIGDLVEDIRGCEYLDGITFSGGDPIFQLRGCAELAERIKKEFGFNIWLYTGYIIEDLVINKSRSMVKLLNNIDVVVDGRYEENLKTSLIPFVGSSNQRVINIKDISNEEERFNDYNTSKSIGCNVNK